MIYCMDTGQAWGRTDEDNLVSWRQWDDTRRPSRGGMMGRRDKRAREAEGQRKGQTQGGHFPQCITSWRTMGLWAESHVPHSQDTHFVEQSELGVSPSETPVRKVLF